MEAAGICVTPRYISRDHGISRRAVPTQGHYLFVTPTKWNISELTVEADAAIEATNRTEACRQLASHVDFSSVVKTD